MTAQADTRTQSATGAATRAAPGLLSLPRPETFAIPLLDAISIDHGPADVLGPFFMEADRAMRNVGIRLYLSTDFSRLSAFNAANLPTWYRYWPAFLDSGGAGPHNGYFIVGADEQEIVLTQVGRFYEMPDGLTEHCRSLRLMYDDPADAMPGEQCLLEGEAAAHGETIRGGVVLSGGTWFKPGKARGRGFAKWLPRISRAYALSRFGTDWTVSTVRRSLVESGVMTAYGYQRLHYHLRWLASAEHGGYDRADDPLSIVSMTKDELITDLREFRSAPPSTLPVGAREPLGAPITPLRAAE